MDSDKIPTLMVHSLYQSILSRERTLYSYGT